MARKSSIDLEQVDALLQAARELGYEPHEIYPRGHSESGKPDEVDALVIARHGKSKVYANDAEWARKAIADLERGFFGKP